MRMFIWIKPLPLSFMIAAQWYFFSILTTSWKIRLYAYYLHIALLCDPGVCHILSSPGTA